MFSNKFSSQQYPKVKKYLEQKFNEQNGKTPKEIKIDGRSNLSKKELALIKLAKEEESVAEKVLGKQTKGHRLVNGLGG